MPAEEKGRRDDPEGSAGSTKRRSPADSGTCAASATVPRRMRAEAEEEVTRIGAGTGSEVERRQRRAEKAGGGSCRQTAETVVGGKRQMCATITSSILMVSPLTAAEASAVGRMTR